MNGIRAALVLNKKSLMLEKRDQRREGERDRAVNQASPLISPLGFSSRTSLPLLGEGLGNTGKTLRNFASPFNHQMKI